MSGLRDYKAVAKACSSGEVRVKAVAPLLYDALNELGILHTNSAIAALATVAVECNFRPVIESYWLPATAWKRWADTTRYGKVDPETGKRYVGRGFIQLTWKGNYQRYGAAIGKDLVNNPDLALDPKIAAQILARYFKEKKVDVAAKQGDWRKVRKLVNGGFNGWPAFKQYVDQLLVLAQRKEGE